MSSTTAPSAAPLSNAFIAEWAPRLLSVVRIVVALLFMQHGLQKLFGLLNGPFQPQAFSLLWFAAIIELLGGVLLLIGLFSRVAAFIMSGEMAVAYFMVHFPKSIFPAVNGGDAAVLFCFIFLYLAAAGPGPWSIDANRQAR
ncbi:DoxX family protein [Acidisphaera sp. L21]|uniref:DoxX family protein n=1 Tax=Acidisphaera sp. L21 TaxID=1641851 RepID=UPI00131EA836|nr:DoxX family protein [Acidisphaera sp. L21]